MQSQLPDDYSPIAEQGELRPEPGPFRRLKQRRDLPALGLGFERVVIDENGRPMSADLITPGESYWSKQVRTWIAIDVGDHALAYSFDFFDQSGRAGFTANVTVNTSVVDAQKAAQRRISSVKGVLQPLLLEAVVAAGEDLEPIKDPHPAVALNKTRRAAESLLRKSLVNRTFDVGWLTATVSSVSVSFDATTQRHHEGLIDRARAGELIGADSDNEKIKAVGALDLREMWREQLAEHLADPSSRALEAVLSDPSPANLRAVVDQLNAVEDRDRAALWQIVETLVDKDYFDAEDDAVKAITDAMRDALRGQPQRSLGSGATHDQVSKGAIESPGRDPVPPEHLDEAPVEDEDWTDR